MMSGGVDFTLWPVCGAFEEISIQELEICTLQASYIPLWQQRNVHAFKASDVKYMHFAIDNQRTGSVPVSA